MTITSTPKDLSGPPSDFMQQFEGKTTHEAMSKVNEFIRGFAWELKIASFHMDVTALAVYVWVAFNVTRRTNPPNRKIGGL